MVDEGIFPKTDGSILYASDVNGFRGKIHQLYAGTGFNSSTDGAAVESSYELNVINPEDLINQNYILISIVGIAKNQLVGGGTESPISLKIQVKEIGSAYSDDLEYKDVFSTINAGDTTKATGLVNLSWMHTITAGEKTNGCQFKVFSKSGATGFGLTNSFTNIQTIVKIIGGN